ncbi:MAG: hypothetical protein A2Y18_01345 [Clostridiales bacterium GWD2_32_19]|nr:MAG: hypothetical protein A2Y18_01345 [Clostridiales bacterium GWD2_32_19]
MNLREEIAKDLISEGKYSNGDVTFEVDENGVRMIFYKKENLPTNLLTGLSEDELSRFNPSEINVNGFISDDIEIVNDDKRLFSLKSKGNIEKCVDDLLKCCYKVQTVYDKEASHITRMFGSYILISKKDDELKAIYSTPPPIKYCPLMFNLLKEIGGNVAEKLLMSLKDGRQEDSQKNMIDLINNVVIKGGGFDDNRPLNSCERNVAFGASEIMSDAMERGKIDAAVIVSNNLGTVITTSPVTTQGVVKRMSGLFYTTPSPELVEEAFKEGVIPVFPFTGKIDQVEGVKQAIKMGYKNISVSVAANDNKYLKQISELEQGDVKIHKFGLCATGINNETAEIMGENADIVWSCASKLVREIIAPKAMAQVGIKIPVYILTKNGWKLVKPRINQIDECLNLDKINLNTGDDMPIIYNKNDGLEMMKFEELDKSCIDCPRPCI